MLYPDWKNGKLLIESYNSNGSYIIKNNGYIHIYTQASRGAARVTLNNHTIALASESIEMGTDWAINLIPVKKNDLLSYSLHVGSSGGTQLIQIFYYPFRRWNSANSGILYPDWFNKQTIYIGNEKNKSFTISKNGYILVQVDVRGTNNAILLNGYQIVGMREIENSINPIDENFLIVKKGDILITKGDTMGTPLPNSHKNYIIYFFPFRR